jgi:predicted DCC family thiol-disulfide oxidoreductase YuxK
MTDRHTTAGTYAGAGNRFYLGSMPARATPGPDGHPVLFFDGVCPLCNGFADFVMARDGHGRFRIAALQGETAQAMGAMAAMPPAPATAQGESDPLRSFLLWDGGSWYRRSDAALRVIAGLGGPWRLAWALLWIPRILRDTVYDFIARNRYRWFGKREACRFPAPSERDRFLP